jgi:DNA-binding phage protein
MVKRHKLLHHNRRGRLQPQNAPLLDEVLIAIRDSGQSLRTIADATGVNRSTLALWGHQTSHPHLRTLTAVADHLGYEIGLIRRRLRSERPSVIQFPKVRRWGR